MENYIVRIYDRDPDDAERVTGVLESVEQQTGRPFHSIGALRSMLSAPAKGALPVIHPSAGSRVERHLAPRPPNRVAEPTTEGK
jgi:hypothetical protein